MFPGLSPPPERCPQRPTSGLVVGAEEEGERASRPSTTASDACCRSAFTFLQELPSPGGRTRPRIASAETAETGQPGVAQASGAAKVWTGRAIILSRNCKQGRQRLQKLPVCWRMAPAAISAASPVWECTCVDPSDQPDSMARRVHCSSSTNTKSGRFPRPAQHLPQPFPLTHPRGPAISPGRWPLLFTSRADLPPGR